MLAASVSLVLEGRHRSTPGVALGVLAGVAFTLVLSRPLHAPHEELALGSLRGGDAVKALLIVAVMTVHSVTEGVGVRGGCSCSRSSSSRLVGSGERGYTGQYTP